MKNSIYLLFLTIFLNLNCYVFGFEDRYLDYLYCTEEKENTKGINLNSKTYPALTKFTQQHSPLFGIYDYPKTFNQLSIDQKIASLTKFLEENKEHFTPLDYTERCAIKSELLDLIRAFAFSAQLKSLKKLNNKIKEIFQN